ncbi:unnamed protein product [Cylicocyclus nassatus]|uniref:Uncharacterized protein n=1 Tax=Cylicocyclus nassatus TaxID=53992 RepID=A0AA36GF37_CYLNA|nr:unnamed protein product [Cylicocyclus nassatus]
MQKRRTSPNNKGLPCKPVPEIWKEALQQPMSRNDGSDPNQVVALSYKTGLEARKRSIERAKMTPISNVMWGHALKAFACLHDGSRLLEERNAIFQLYFPTATIRMACEKGLYTLVMDGVKIFLTLEWRYPIFMFQIPFAYAFTGKKNQQTQVPICFDT